MSTLADIRKKLQAQDRTQGGNATGGRDNATYAHWDLADNGTSLLRFLPDGDTENTFFWAERQLIKIPFAGVKGDKDSKELTVQVPCMDMWERNQCPVITEIAPWWNDKNLESLARVYWKKRSYMMQGFVVEDGIVGATAPENPIRKFIISPQIFKVIKGALLDPDMENNPTDLNLGTNFRVNKTKNGQWADYSTSNWARKETSLSNDQLEAIAKHGLFKLSDFLPKRPNADELQAIKEMFEASVNGDLYDLDRWGKFYKPYGLGGNDNADTKTDTVSQIATPKAAPIVVKTESAPVDTTFNGDATGELGDTRDGVSGPAAASGSAQDILARIRRRSSET